MKKPIISESSLEKKLGEYLSPFFNVYYQQWSVCMRKRIDIVLVHKKTHGFHIGIEVKNNGNKNGKDLGGWLNQASAYNKYAFCNKQTGFEYGIMPILVAPTISGEYLECLNESGSPRHSKYHEHHNVNSLLAGAFNVGEIRKRITGYEESKNEYLAFSFNNRTLWKEFGHYQNGDHVNIDAYRDTVLRLVKAYHS